MILLGISLSCVSPVILVSMQLLPSMSPLWYYISSGSTGLVNWLAVALSSVADILLPQYRASGFGLVLACFSLGFAVSPMIGATFNHFHSSLFCCMTLIVAWINAICFLPETLPEDAAIEAKNIRNQRNAGVTALQAVKAFFMRPIQEISILNRNQLFRMLSILAFFSGMVSSADQTILIYYVKERLYFDNSDIAKMFILSGAIGIFVQCLLIKPLINIFGERLVIVIAFVSFKTSLAMSIITLTLSQLDIRIHSKLSDWNSLEKDIDFRISCIF
jgi:Na+/melibiose symporter-like transporter